MGKSIKKHPIIKQGSVKHRKFHKKQANRKVRYAKDVPNGKQYRKYYESWEINDSVMRYSIHEFLAFYESELKQFHAGVFEGYYRTITEEGIHKEYDINKYLKTMYRK